MRNSYRALPGRDSVLAVPNFPDRCAFGAHPLDAGDCSPIRPASRADYSEGSDTQCGGFTLIELLCTIAIIAVLASLLLPEVGQVRNKAMSVQCSANLRQFGVVVNLYLADHDNTYPAIETAPPGSIVSQTGPPYQNNPPYTNQPNIQAQTLAQAFAPYVENISQQTASQQNFAPTEAISKLLQCPSDMVSGTNSNYSQYGASYMWSPVVDGETGSNLTLVRRGALRAGQPSTVKLMSDFTPVHQLNPQSLGTINKLFADGHVTTQ